MEAEVKNRSIEEKKEKQTKTPGLSDKLVKTDVYIES